MKETVILGTGVYPVLLKSYIEGDGGKVAAFAVDRAYMDEKELEGLPVVPVDELKGAYPPERYDLLCGIGYKKLGKIRRDVFMRCRELGYSFASYIHPTAVIDPDAKLGEGNIIFENVVIQKNAVLGDANLLFSNSTVMHDNSIGSFVTIGAGAVLNGYVSVDGCCFIGSGATLRDHIKVGEDVLVGAGVYVNRDCPAGMAVLPAASSYCEGMADRFSDNL